MSRIIDMHAHIFPDKIAEKASASVGSFYDIPTLYDGRAETLLRMGEKAGISRFLVQSVATVPGQVGSINRFIADQVKAHPSNFIGFGALHPDLDDMEAEVENIIDLGLKGVKLHPDFQRFNIDSPAAMRMYRAFAGKLPLLIHTGDYRYGYSSPKRLARVMRELPELTVIAAHLGGWSEWPDAEEALAGQGFDNLYVDTSSSLYCLTAEVALRIINGFGEDKVLFGTDFPMWDLTEELERLHSLQLSADVLDKILFKNAERLLGI